MKIKKRLVMSFSVIIIIPIILGAIAIRLVDKYRFVAERETYGVFVMNSILVLLVLLVIAGLVLSLWIYNGILTPIKKLKKATEDIMQGNLDFTLEVDKKDEIGELCDNFEQMRYKLKESAEAKLEQDKESKILISNICHDLKTPITAIKGYVEGIIDGVADTPEKQERYIKTIYNKASEMDTLINELTIYSKLDTNRVPYNFQKINVADYFDDCLEEIGVDLEGEKMELGYYNYADRDMLVIADPEQLKRVINNIVGNAMKYMNKEKRCINIRIKDVGDFAQIEIEDNGKGIAPKDLPYVFDRFYRADSSRNETKGNGIGLSIVRKILEDHGGKIWATSKENVGTTMYFVIRKYQEVPNE
ncbi:MAG: HAMP domain-containing sensor histidine kinase [Lachnospiraceae bacterium]